MEKSGPGSGTPADPGPPFARTGPRRAALAALTTTIACALPVFLVGGMAVQISAELRFSPAGLGLAVAAYFGVSALASVPAGALVERFGATAVARSGIALAAACLLTIAAAARSLAGLVTLLALGAAANALGQLASNTTLARYVPARRQGLSFGVKQAAIPVSTLLAGAAVPAVALTLGWRWAFALAALLAAGAWLLVPTDGRHLRPTRGARGERATVTLVVLGAAATLAAGAASALGTFLVDAGVARGLPPGTAGLMLTLGSAACVAARLFGGWQADLRPDRQVGTIATLLALGAVGLGLIAAPGMPALVVGVLLGFGLGWSWPGLMNFAVVRLHAHAPAAATSITQTGVYAGGCLGPLTLGGVAAAAGYPTMWVVGSLAMLCASALMLLGSRMLRRHPRASPTGAPRPS